MSETAEKTSLLVAGDENEDVISTQSEQEEVTCKTVGDKKHSTLKFLKLLLSRYLQFIQSPHRQDSILKTVQYSLWLLSKFYRNSGTTKRQIPLRVAESLLKLQGEISWTRYVLRFFGLPAAINDVDLNLKTSLSTDNNFNQRLLGQVMSWTMVAYFPLENLSYLFYKAPEIRWLPCAVPSTPKIEDATSCQNIDSRKTTGYYYSSARLASATSAWSCRFWATWIVLDILRCTLVLRDIQQTSHSSSGTAKRALDDNDEVNHKEIDKEEEPTQHQDGDKEIATVRTEHLQIVRNMLYLLPAINWSLPQWDTQPWLSGDLVNGLCWLESLVGLYQGVRNFQQT